MHITKRSPEQGAERECVCAPSARWVTVGNVYQPASGVEGWSWPAAT